ncbi:MAG: DUF4079 family protein [bacterium]
MSGLWGYIHPIHQGAVIALGLITLALGLRVRRGRRRPGPGQARLAALHMRLGRWFTALFSAGYLLGLAGMRFALGDPNFETAHAYFGTIALLLLLGTAYLGRRLRLRPAAEDTRQLHSYCGFLAIFVALAVAFLGMNLLP